MEVGQLRYIIAAAENGSFRRAAKFLQVQQSSVSRAIQQLEDDLGVSLFERQSTGSRLTDAGRRLLRKARPALEQLDLARKTAAAAGVCVNVSGLGSNAPAKMEIRAAWSS